jgi:iron complex outermembrane receptor protein
MKKVYLSAISASIILLSTSAISSDNVIKLKTVTVEGEKKKIYSVPIPLRQSLTASSEVEAEQDLKKIAGSVNLVSSKQFEKTRAANTKDILQFVPGVYVQTRYGEEARLSIRGSGLSRTFHLRGIKLLQDGIPMNLADGGADFQEIDASAYDYLEVYKGANALKYGANTLGGAVNFVTPTGYTADKFRAGVDVGSYDTKRAFASSGGVVGKADYFVSLSNYYSRGYRQHSDQNNTRLFSNVGYRFNENLETRFYYTFANINQEIPGNLTKAQAETNPKAAATSTLTGDNARDYFLHRFANKTTYKGEDFEANAGAYTVQKDLYHPIFQVVDQQNNDFGVFANSTFFGSIFGLENEFLVGSNLSTGRTDAQQYVNVGGSAGAQTNFTLQKSNNIDFFFENSIKPTEKLSLISGSQVVYSQRDYADYFFTDGDRSGEKLYKGLSPKFGAIYEVSENAQVFTNYSWAYEPPTFSELTQNIAGVSGLADIEAQRSQTFEIGTRGETNKIKWEAAWYYAWLKDELMTYSLGGTSTGVLNAKDTIHTGFELGLSAVVAENSFVSGDNFQLQASYTYNDFKFDEDPSWRNNAIPGAPDHFLIAELRYNHPSSFYIAPTFETTPEKYPVDMANTLYADPYATIGLKAGYDIAKDTTVFMDARNLLNKNYTATTGVITQVFAGNQAQFTPADGRSVFFGVRYKFN